MVEKSLDTRISIHPVSSHAAEGKFFSHFHEVSVTYCLKCKSSNSVVSDFVTA